MPSATILAEVAFIEEYKKLQASIAYMQQMAQAIQNFAKNLEASTIYPTALSSSEQAAISSASSAAGAFLSSVPISTSNPTM